MLVDRHANLREIWIGLHLKGSKSRDRVTGAVTADVATTEKHRQRLARQSRLCSAESKEAPCLFPHWW